MNHLTSLDNVTISYSLSAALYAVGQHNLMPEYVLPVALTQKSLLFSSKRADTGTEAVGWKGFGYPHFWQNLVSA